MSYLSELEKVLALSKQNKKTAVTNEKIADFNRQYKPTKENNKAWKEANQLRKDLENIEEILSKRFGLYVILMKVDLKNLQAVLKSFYVQARWIELTRLPLLRER